MGYYGGPTNIPSFSYTFTAPIPSWSFIPPDTIHKSLGFSFPCSFVGADSVMVLLGLSNTNTQFSKVFSGNTTSISFTASEMSNLNLANASLQVFAFKFNLQTVNYKHFLFTKGLAITCGQTVIVQ